MLHLNSYHSNHSPSVSGVPSAHSGPRAKDIEPRRREDELPRLRSRGSAWQSSGRARNVAIPSWPKTVRFICGSCALETGNSCAHGSPPPHSDLPALPRPARAPIDTDRSPIETRNAWKKRWFTGTAPRAPWIVASKKAKQLRKQRHFPR